MDNSTFNDEHLLRYLDGDLPETERSALESRLLSDEVLQHKLEGLKVAREAVIRAGLKEKISGIHNEMMNEFSSVKTSRPKASIRHLYRYAVAAAAAVLLIFTVIRVIEYNTPSAEKLFKKHYIAYVPSAGRDPGETTTSAIEKAYRDKDYLAVIKLADSGSLSAADHFYSGLALLEMGEATEAIRFLEQYLSVADTSEGGSVMFDAAEQYLALAYLKNRNYEKAHDLMTRIQRDSSHTYHNKFSEKLIKQVRILQ